MERKKVWELISNLYYFIIGLGLTVSASIYLSRLNDTSPKLYCTQIEPPDIIPPPQDYLDVDCPGRLSNWRFYAILGIIMGILCLLASNPWFKLISCESDTPGSKLSRKYTVKNFQSNNTTSDSTTAATAQRTGGQSQEAKDSWFVVCTCCCTCMLIVLAVTYILALFLIPIYLCVKLWYSEATKTVDSTLAIPAHVLFWILVIHVSLFALLVLEFVRKVCVGCWRDVRREETEQEKRNRALYERVQKAGGAMVLPASETI